MQYSTVQYSTVQYKLSCCIRGRVCSPPDDDFSLKVAPHLLLLGLISVSLGCSSSGYAGEDTGAELGGLAP